MDASWTCVETCVGWPNALASFLTSTRESQETHFKIDISCISLAKIPLMDVTQLALTWFGWPNGEKLASNCVQIWSKVSASHHKSTQVHARPGQKDSQVGPSFQLASTCESVWSGLQGTCQCVWPPNASLHASSTCAHLQPVAVSCFMFMLMSWPSSLAHNKRSGPWPEKDHFPSIL